MADFKWSYSSLKEYDQCPKKYFEIRVAKNFKQEPTQAMIYGNEVHSALELYVKEGKPLAKNYERFKPFVDDLINIPGDKLTEYKMGLKKDRTACDYDDPDRWARGIADLIIVDNDYAFVIDYKTGSNKYPDPKQLRLMSLMMFAHFPEVKKVKAGLLFILHNTFIPQEYERADVEKSWTHFESALMRLDNSFEQNVWQPKPTPLCKWCPVKTCEFNR